MTAGRIYNPGLGTLLTHLVVTGLLWTVLVPLIGLRIVLVPLTEAVIRACDAIHDTLTDRLEL